MTPEAPLLTSQARRQVCLFLIAAIAMAGGALQFVLGQPDTTPRLDNVHRFMAGMYFSTGLIALWAALTVASRARWSTCSPSACCWPASAGWCRSRRSGCRSRPRLAPYLIPSWCCRWCSRSPTTRAG